MGAAIIGPSVAVIRRGPVPAVVVTAAVAIRGAIGSSVAIGLLVLLVVVIDVLIVVFTIAVLVPLTVAVIIPVAIAVRVVVVRVDGVGISWV